MAPVKGLKKSGTAKGNLKSSRTSSVGPSISKKSKTSRGPPPKQVKSKPKSQPVQKKRQKTYADQELDLPALNMITPAGVQTPRGKKKGKVFVDDQESMMTILAMVNAEKEGQIESKMVKARQMEAIREAKLKEAEARSQKKQAKLEETKAALKEKRTPPKPDRDNPPNQKSSRKRVSFA